MLAPVILYVVGLSPSFTLAIESADDEDCWEPALPAPRATASAPLGDLSAAPAPDLAPGSRSPAPPETPPCPW